MIASTSRIFNQIEILQLPYSLDSAPAGAAAAAGNEGIFV
jgi:hypothetical protein